MVFRTRKAGQRRRGRENVSRWAILAAVLGGICFQLAVTGSVMAQQSLFDEIGIGANWGPHWSSGIGASKADVRDTQDDGAFPAEICLIANAGFKTIRMYGENMETWIAVLDAVDDYNRGKLNCNPAAGPAQVCDDTSATKPCLAVVYQAGICGPDPSALAWNGQYQKGDIDKIPCHGTGTMFTQSVGDETAKLKQILNYAGEKFAKWVPLVIVGNEILYSRGVCSNNNEQACTEDNDCGGGDAKCDIQHFCSFDLSSDTQPETNCTSSASCAGRGTCTDVTNFAAISYAFDQVQEILAKSLPNNAKPPKLTISLQADVLTAPSFGDDWRTAGPMYSRWMVQKKLQRVGNVLAVNVYPDQWGMVLKQSNNHYLSCIDETNAVQGTTLPGQCSGTPDAYKDARTGLAAHSIADYLQVLNRRYFPGTDLLITETGWHTAGTCTDYNDSTSSYSPARAAAYYSDLYSYAQKNQVPVLVFELFDQKTKTCTSDGEPAEANYGIFDNYCRMKGDEELYLNSFLPQQGPGSPGAKLDVFRSMLDGDSCEKQTLIGVIGTGDSGVCYYNPEYTCQSGYNPKKTLPYECPAPPDGVAQNPCVWGFCEDGSRGCNPDDTDANLKDGCKCVRKGVCANNTPPAGVYVATHTDGGTTWNAACSQDSDCDDATAPFSTDKCSETKTCGCYAELAPSTLFRTITDNTPVEGPGFKLTYQTPGGTFNFNKTRTLSQKILGEGRGVKLSQVQTVWGNIFMGKGWKLTVNAPDGAKADGTIPTKTIKTVTPGQSNQQAVTWDNATSWTDFSYGTLPVTTAINETQIHFPRGFLKDVRTVPVTQANLTPYRPTGWPDRIVISKESGTSKDRDTFYTTDSLHVDWAVINNDQAATEKAFKCALLVDGVVRARWTRSTTLKPGAIMSIKDYPLGSLPAGTHKIRIVADATDAIPEMDESDNAYTETIIVKKK